MPLRWETPDAIGPTLGYTADGLLVARVVRRGNGWEGWYDQGGLERPTRAPFSQEPAGRLVGHWASPGEALDEMNRHHDRTTRSLPPTD